MANAPETFGVDSSFEPQTGQPVEVVEGIVRVTAPNAGPYTFTGTNSFIVGVDRLAIIDPGPNDSRHFKALLKAIDGRTVEAILLTHTHRDHSDLARRLRKATKAPIYSNGRHRLYRPASWLERRAISRSCDLRLEPDEIIEDGGHVKVDGIRLAAMATPGHCANHLAYSVGGTPYLFTGDHVMGWSSTVVAPPDGAMGDYLFALEKVIVAPFSYYLPAHGGPIAEGRRYARSLLAHRQLRSAQIIEGVESGADSIDKLVARIYPTLNVALRPAARKTTEAHIDYLVARNELKIKRGPMGSRFSRGPGKTAAVPAG